MVIFNRKKTPVVLLDEDEESESESSPNVAENQPLIVKPRRSFWPKKPTHHPAKINPKADTTEENADEIKPFGKINNINKFLVQDNLSLIKKSNQDIFCLC
jgi:hypothetical protein